LVRLKGVLTPVEEKLARDPEGHRLVKDVRRQLLEGSRSIPQLQRLVEQALEEGAALGFTQEHRAERAVPTVKVRRDGWRSWGGFWQWLPQRRPVLASRTFEM
jgi:hypothetical protein